MFIDVNNLVQMQGEMVTRIEDHVNSKSFSWSAESAESSSLTLQVQQ